MLIARLVQTKPRLIYDYLVWQRLVESGVAQVAKIYLDSHLFTVLVDWLSHEVVQVLSTSDHNLIV